MSFPLYISPSNAATSSGGSITFHAVGGSGAGFTWSILTSSSGGFIDPTMGVYTAGVEAGYADTIQVQDSEGNVVTVEVRVLEGPTLLSLRDQAKQRADMVNSQFVTDPEWNGYLNASYKELYDLLITKYGENYEVQLPFSFVTDGISDEYPLPPDFYKLLGVDYQINNAPNGWISLKSFNFPERNRFAIPNLQAFYGVLTNLRYRVVGRNVRFIPRAAAGQTLRLWYVPRPSLLTSDASVIDGVSGWEEYVVVDSVIKALAKEETDVSVFALQKAGLLKRIEDAAANRDAGYPQTVSDVAWQDASWNTGPGWNGGGW